MEDLMHRDFVTVSSNISHLAFKWGHQTAQIKAPMVLKSYLLQQRNPKAS